MEKPINDCLTGGRIRFIATVADTVSKVSCRWLLAHAGAMIDIENAPPIIATIVADSNLSVGFILSTPKNHGWAENPNAAFIRGVISAAAESS